MGAGMLGSIGAALGNIGNQLHTKAMRDDEFDRQQAAALAAEERAAQRGIEAEGRAETRAISAEGRRMQAEKDIDAHKYKTGQERKVAEGAAFKAKKEEWMAKLPQIKDASMRALEAGRLAAEETGDTERVKHYSGEIKALRDDARADKQLDISRQQLSQSAKMHEIQYKTAQLAFERASAEAKIPVAVERKYKTLASTFENKSKVIDTAIAKGEFNPETGKKLLEEQAALAQEMNSLLNPYLPATTKTADFDSKYPPKKPAETGAAAPKSAAEKGLINQPAPKAERPAPVTSSDYESADNARKARAEAAAKKDDEIRAERKRKQEEAWRERDRLNQK